MLTWLVAVALAAAVATAPYALYGVLYATLRPAGPPVEKGAAESTVSILLPTYNEADIVERKLESLCSLDYPMERVEIVVVDSSEDDTSDIVRSFFEGRDEPALELVQEDERRGAAAALNRGVAAASSEIVFRTDADSELDSAAIREAVATLANPEVGAVTGRQTAVLGDSQVERDYRDLQTLLQLVESHLDSTFVFHGPCGAFRREAFEPVAEDALADDSDAAIRIRRGGRRVVVNPAMEFVESGVSGFWARRKRKDRRAMGLVQLLWRNRDALGRFGRYGRLVLPLNWWTMIVSPWLVLIGAILTVVGAVVAAGPAGLAVAGALVVVFVVGQRDALGPAQPIYAVLDSQASLLIAHLRLLRRDSDGTWEVDRESREAFDR